MTATGIRPKEVQQSIKSTTVEKIMPKITLNQLIQTEIARIAEAQSVDTATLEEFAQFIIENHKKKDPKPKLPKVVKPKKVKPLTLTQLKEAILGHFGVKDVKELRKSGSFEMATSGMEKLDFSKKDGWEKLYRKFIGVLPEEENETGYGCVNGINIFKYDLVWKAFGLNPQTATSEDIKSAYHDLSRVYHPDVPNTGDAQVFARLNVFYKSLTERF